MKYLVYLLPILFLGGCAVKQKVLDASAVSMTRSYLKKGRELKEIGDVEGNFCTDSGDRGSVGLMDEAIKDAQKKSKADFILNASFYQEGSCMSVEGTGAKMVRK